MVKLQRANLSASVSPMAKKNPPAKKPTKRDPDETEDQDANDEDGEGDDEGEDNAEAENRRINAIVTSRVKREMKPLLAQMSTLTDAITKLSAKKEEPADDDEDEDGQGEGEDKKAAPVDPKITRKLTKMEKELADEKAARKKAETERAEEQEKAKRTEMRTIFSAALQEHGVTDPKLLRAALNVLEEDGVMIRDEDGKVKFKGQDKYGIETNFDPKVGLKSWVTTEGKSFVPAVDAGGSGTGGATRGIGNSNLTSKEFSKLSDQQKASINLERACSGQPPLGE